MRSKDVKKIGGFPLGSPVERWRHDRIEDIKGYVLMKGELYCKMQGGILSRCMGREKDQRKLKEVHSRTCGFYGEISLYCGLQRVGFYWPNIGKDEDLIQT